MRLGLPLPEAPIGVSNVFRSGHSYKLCAGRDTAAFLVRFKVELPHMLLEAPLIDPVAHLLGVQYPQHCDERDAPWPFLLGGRDRRG